ncbi:hypothetical protein M1B35_00540 [Pseudomonas sp. MAFF 302046]|uniref:Pilus assembly protein n=1 Tax=Pseudomonas morbosilactucae TaxID=2938197 RepID=A0ABT0J9V9_9PSED|nr:hypothetical protein [Pseudomonas morbosilactucae]MCK9812671.1 hypothetical protein [Pseudomonas morbosilactucae]
MPAPSSLSPLRRLWRDQQAVTATETAFILPVLLFAVMILFELARIAMMIGIGSLALEHAVQDFRREKSFYQKSPDLLQADIETRMLEYSYGFLTEDNLEIDVLPFDNLHLFGQDRKEATPAEKEQQAQSFKSPPILSVTVDLTQTFITPLPALFGLGNGFQYQYRHLLGNLPSEDPSEDDA